LTAPAAQPRGGNATEYSYGTGASTTFNARMTEQKRSLSLSEVRAQLAATHGRLVEFIQSAPEHQLIGKPASVIDYGSIRTSHYPLHAAAIRQWRQRISNEPRRRSAIQASTELCRA